MVMLQCVCWLQVIVDVLLLGYTVSLCNNLFESCLIPLISDDFI